MRAENSSQPHYLNSHMLLEITGIHLQITYSRIKITGIYYFRKQFLSDISYNLKLQVYRRVIKVDMPGIVPKLAVGHVLKNNARDRVVHFQDGQSFVGITFFGEFVLPEKFNKVPELLR